MLTGKVKTDYQREYMRRRRAKKAENGPNRVTSASQDAPGRTLSVRPDTLGPSVRPKLDPVVRPKTQHTNPMMVGYEPPRFAL